jgi:hypothetical protein
MTCMRCLNRRQPILCVLIFHGKQQSLGPCDAVLCNAEVVCHDKAVCARAWWLAVCCDDKCIGDYLTVYTIAPYACSIV